MRVCFDSSAFAKRYINESGTSKVIELCHQAEELLLATLVIPEVVSAFCRLLRQGDIDQSQYDQLKTDFLTDIADATFFSETPEVMRQAILVLEQHPLRAMDAIHIGAALTAEPDVFVSADKRQCSAAQQMGLPVFSLGGV